MEALLAYLPEDRAHALAHGLALRDYTHGAALFADISGFTPLTEELTRALGARAGIEALTDSINAVYAVLTEAVVRWHGSVIGFSGDAITCWFDEADGSAAQRASTCALALQAAMAPFAAISLPGGHVAALTLKVAVAAGPVRRLVVGDPAIQQIDVLAGTPLARAAVGEYLAQAGEVLLDVATVAALRGGDFGPQRVDAESGEVFTLLTALAEVPPAHPWPEVALAAEAIRPWVPPFVWEHSQAGLGDFLTELRPAVALFLSFNGFDYDADDRVGVRLDDFIRRVQSTLAEAGGTLLQLTVGDKGSYLYVAFGAPVAHEDDARRAARAALSLRRLPSLVDGLQSVQIGISAGIVRAGAYGGGRRRTYGVLGDEVNLAARLMARAEPDAILVSGRVRHSLVADFNLEPLAPMLLKGLPESLPVFQLTGERAIPLLEPAYTLPMVGREAEFATLMGRVDAALSGRGQIVGITAEAGLGKSRLVAEVLRLARRRGMRTFGGACQSYGTSTPYLVWQSIFRAFFELDPAGSPRRQRRVVESLVEDLAPERAELLPLLGPLLGLPLEENDFTRALGPQQRKGALDTLLLDCVRAAAREAAADGAGLLFLLEDLHWVDPTSHDLLDLLAQTIANLPVLIVLAYRPPELARLQTPRIEALPHFTRVELTPLGLEACALLMRAKLAQLLPERRGAAPAALLEQITARAQGNPFYVEELLNYLHDRGIDLHDRAAVAMLDLPASLHSLILSRIDQLSARQQAELKIASVIGRQFLFAWLHGAFPELGVPELLQADLEELAALELTPHDPSTPELAYLFKHVVTREVAYAGLSAAARARLHERLAAYLEAGAGETVEPPLDLLAYHYGLSENQAKQRHYLERAGVAAAARFANQAALEYLSRALELTPAAEVEARYRLLLARMQVHDHMGTRAAQREDLDALAGLAEALGDAERQAEVGVLRAQYYHRAGDFPAALAEVQQALRLAEASGARRLVMRAHERWAWTLHRQRANAAARERAAASLAEARVLGDRRGEAAALNLLGVIAGVEQDSAGSAAYLTKSLGLYQEVNDRWGIGVAQSNLMMIDLDQGNLARARELTTESLRFYQLTGARRDEGISLFNLSVIAYSQGDNSLAASYLEQALAIVREIGATYDEANFLRQQGGVHLAQGELDVAAESYQRSLALQSGGSGLQRAGAVVGLARVAFLRGEFATALAHVEAVLAAYGPGLAAATQPSLFCYDVLRAAGDPRADGVLDAAYQHVQERAQRLADPAARRMFLQRLDRADLLAVWRERHGEV